MTDNQNKSDYPLLIEGARSFPQALAAIGEFQTQVVEACRKALEVELPKISTAMGTKLSRSDFKDRVRPRKLQNADGVDASLGILIDREREGWRQYYLINWEKEGLGATSSIWFKDEASAMKTSNALKKAKPKLPYFVDLWNREAYLMRVVTAEEMADLPEILRGLFCEWTRLWQRVGGLRSCKA